MSPSIPILYNFASLYIRFLCFHVLFAWSSDRKRRQPYRYFYNRLLLSYHNDQRARFLRFSFLRSLRVIRYPNLEMYNYFHMRKSGITLLPSSQIHILEKKL